MADQGEKQKPARIGKKPASEGAGGAGAGGAASEEQLSPLKPEVFARRARKQKKLDAATEVLLTVRDQADLAAEMKPIMDALESTIVAINMQEEILLADAKLERERKELAERDHNIAVEYSKAEGKSKRRRTVDDDAIVTAVEGSETEKKGNPEDKDDAAPAAQSL